MVSRLATIALCAGAIVAASVPSSSAASATSTSSSKSACSTVTSAQTVGWQNVVVETVTGSTARQITLTRMVPSYKATSTAEMDGYDTQDAYVTVTGSTTRTKPVSTTYVASACTETETV
jgi:hypothetical protein